MIIAIIHNRYSVSKSNSRRRNYSLSKQKSKSTTSSGGGKKNNLCCSLSYPRNEGYSI